MKKGLTHLVFVMDRSGSMSSIISESIDGFNSLIKDQKEDCINNNLSATITLVIFDDRYDVLYSNKDIKEIENLTKSEFYARGSTALLDAVCRTINSVGNDLAKLTEEDRPEKVLFTIITDGQENYSKEFTGTQLKEMIKHQEDKYNWKFNFIGANIDSFTTGGSYGISVNNTSNYVADSIGVKAMFRGVSTYTSGARKSLDLETYCSTNSLSDMISEEDNRVE